MSYLETAVDIAREAGALLANYFERRVAFELKGDFDLVTGLEAGDIIEIGEQSVAGGGENFDAPETDRKVDHRGDAEQGEDADDDLGSSTRVHGWS